MKIEIEIDDITLFAKALNNAYMAYADIAWGIYLGCDIPTKFEPLKQIPYEALDDRVKCLKNVYEQVEAIEQGVPHTQNTNEEMKKYSIQFCAESIDSALVEMTPNEAAIVKRVLEDANSQVHGYCGNVYVYDVE